MREARYTYIYPEIYIFTNKFCDEEENKTEVVSVGCAAVSLLIESNS